jgi:putative endonuclease
MFYYNYLLKSKKDGRMYTGITNNLRKRLWEHNNGVSIYTKGRDPFILIYYEACLLKEKARSRELYLKSGMGKRYLKNRLGASYL